MAYYNKLPKDSFYCLRIGTQYFAGLKPRFEKSISGTSFRRFTTPMSKDEAVKRSRSRRPSWLSYFRRTHYDKKNANNTNFEPKKKDVKPNILGYDLVLTDDIEKSKNFRRLSQAQNVYNRLEKLYKGIAKPVIEIHENGKPNPK